MLHRLVELDLKSVGFYEEILLLTKDATLAIFCTVCCCLPFGIVGILKASKVSDYYLMKQYDAATQAANDAKKWSMIGIVTGGIFRGYKLIKMLLR